MTLLAKQTKSIKSIAPAILNVKKRQKTIKIVKKATKSDTPGQAKKTYKKSTKTPLLLSKNVILNVKIDQNRL